MSEICQDVNDTHNDTFWEVLAYVTYQTNILFELVNYDIKHIIQHNINQYLIDINLLNIIYNNNKILLKKNDVCNIIKYITYVDKNEKLNSILCNIRNKNRQTSYQIELFYTVTTPTKIRLIILSNKKIDKYAYKYIKLNDVQYIAEQIIMLLLECTNLIT